MDRIRKEDAARYRAAGYRLHAEFRGRAGDESCPDAYDWYAGTADEVANYHRNGGTWAYTS